jgi:DNA-directed RNA polymerase specialized sigma24 family protein
MKQSDQVDLLDRAGYRQREIAEFIGSTTKSVSVRLAEVRRARKHLRNRKKRERSPGKGLIG